MKQIQNTVLRNLLVVSICVLFISTLTSCNKADVLGPLKGQALKLIQEHAGKLIDLKAKLGPLASKIGMIPDSIPGAVALKKAFGEKQGELTGLQSLLSEAPATIETAVKDGNKDALTAILGKLQGAEKSIEGIGSFVGEATNKVSDLEKLTAVAKSTEVTDALGFSKTLSTGYAIKGTTTGVESILITFMDDDSMKADKTKWFNFDRLTFTTGSANLDMDKSKNQLTNMYEIMKAYPTMNIKLGGYTDNTGKPAKNLALSKSRAESVVKALVTLGTDVKRIQSEGYGDAHPVCEANDTPKCRAQNRRIAINVIKK